MPASRRLLALVILMSFCGCRSLSSKEEEFLRQYRHFLHPKLRTVYLEEPERRPEVEQVALQLLKDNVREPFRRAVLSGTVRRGMTEKEVLFALGPPRKKYSASAGGVTQEWWVYGKGKGDDTLAMHNGVLVAIGPEGEGPMAAPELEGKDD